MQSTIQPRNTSWYLGLFGSLLLVLVPALHAAEDIEADVSLAQMEKQLALYQGADASDPAKLKLAELYTAAVANLRSVAENRERQEHFERLHAEAPAKVERSAAQLLELQNSARSAETLSAHLNIKRLDQLLEDTQDKLVELRARQESLGTSQQNLQRRADDARSELKALRAQGDENAAPVPRAGENTVLTQARRDEWRSRTHSAQSMVARLETEIRTIPSRLGAVQAQLKLIAAQLEQNENLHADLLSTENLRRVGEAQELRKQLSQQLAAADSRHPRIAQLISELDGLANEYVSLVLRSETVAEELDATNFRLGELRKSSDSIVEQLRIASINDALGPVLMEHYAKLDGYRKAVREELRIAEMLAQARLREFQVGQLIQSANQTHDRIYRDIESTQELDDEPFGDAERAAALAQADRLLGARTQLLGELDQSYVHATEQIVELDSAYRDQAEVAARLRGLLDRNLIWMTSHPALSLQDLAQWPGATLRLLGAKQWSGVRKGLVSAVRDNLLGLCFPMLLLALLMRYRSRMKARLAERNVRAVGWRNYRFSMALEALAIHLLVATPLPLMLLTLGWLSATVAQPGSMTAALSFACYRIAVLFYGYLVVLEALKPNGIARQHLRWKAARVQAVHRLFRIALWVMLPLTFFNSLIATLPARMVSEQAHRIGPLLVTLVFFVFSVQILRAGRGMFNSAFFSRTHPMLLRVASLLVVAVVAIAPLAVVLEILGYHFTAHSLQMRAFVTIVVMIFTKIISDMGLLGITIASQRSIASQQQEEERIAASEADGAAARSVEAADDINWEQLNASAAALLHVVVFGGVALVLASVWGQFFTAMEVFDTVVVWQYQTVTDGVETLAEVSLFNLASALLVFVLSMVLARGLPSVIGIVFYSLITQKGVLFAIQTMVQYLMVIAGTLVSLQMVGFGWSKLQWMAAGLSVGVGFGLQAIFANFFAGLIMLFERPVRIGDVITLGEFSGTIQRIRMRATTIVDFDNREIIVPNQMFVTERLINWTLSSSVVRSTFEVGISYDANPRLASETLLAIMRAEPRVLPEPPPSVVFREFGASSLNLRCAFHVDDVNTRFVVQNDLMMRINEVFREKGIEIAYPQLDLHVRNMPPAEASASA